MTLMSREISNRLKSIAPGTAVLLAMLLALLTITGLTVYSSFVLDAHQKRDEERVVSSALQDALAKLGDGLRPNAYWDVAYDHLSRAIDPIWAKQNLGPYAHDTSDVTMLFVMNRKGKAIYSYSDPANDPKALNEVLASEDIQEIRHEALRKTTVPTNVVTNFILVRDKVYLAAAAQVMPNDERATRKDLERNVEIYLQHFDARMIAKVRKYFQVNGVTLALGAAPVKSAVVNIIDPENEVIAKLWWWPQRPGFQFQLSLLPYFAAIALVCGFLMHFAIVRWIRTARQLERKKLEADSLRQESNAKSAFLGTISHELRTPLNAVMGFSTMLIDKVFGPLGAPQYAEYAESIYSSGKNLLVLVNDVIELSRLQAGDRRFACEAVDVRMTIGDAIDAIEPWASSHGVKLDWKKPDGDCMALTSAPGLHDIVMRLLDNAVKFSDVASEVSIRVETGSSVSIIIQDEGCGISADVLSNLGKPFQAAGSHLNRKHGGLGIGLAISNEIAKLIGCTIRLQSDSGHGTIAIITLPAASESAVYARMAA